MTVKKGIRMKRRARTHTASRFMKSLPTAWITRNRGISVAVLGALILAIWFAPSSTPSATTEPRSVETNAMREPARAVTAPVPTREDVAAANTAGTGRDTSGAAPETVTITGCLERSDNEFRLNDTTGINAPKSRSWKSGFLVKRPADVTVVSASTDVQLSRHIGHRVAVTGPLNDRQMKVRALRPLSLPCGTSRVKA